MGKTNKLFLSSDMSRDSKFSPLNRHCCKTIVSKLSKFLAGILTFKNDLNKSRKNSLKGKIFCIIFLIEKAP